MLRIVAYAPDGVRRFPVHKSPMSLGSEAGNDVALAYPGVAGRHALLHWDGETLEVEDLGSRKGVVVAGERVRGRSRVELLDEVRLGTVTLLMEEALPEPEPEPAPPEPVPPAEPALAPETMIAHLARVTEWVLTDVESRTTAESLIDGLLADFGGGVLVLLHGDLTEPGIKLLVASDEAWLPAAEDLVDQVRRHLAGRNGSEEDGAPPASPWSDRSGGAITGTVAGQPAWICFHFFVAVERPYILITAFPRFRPGDWSPVDALRALGDLVILGLVHHVGWYEPILPGHQGRQELVLDPGVVVGESPPMRRAVELLRAAVDPPVHVLLRGETGTGKELLARSLHQSSPRRNQPMIVASCAGGSPMQVEADLFGAEVPGRDGPVRREGKLVLADGGTLYLRDVDRLPLELQARLVRFLRSGEVEPAGSRSVQRADVRIVAAAAEPLEPLARRDLFRVDLAYRLSQFAVDVPPVRERKEDLPLLVQRAINLVCHETGKRMAGITVKAMSALLAYDYPGNLPELENIVRQAVHLTASGRPIDAEMLPEKVRLASVRGGTRVDATTSDLDLERLVAATEEEAIREALKRTQGNKTQAAKLLGLSRNGLALKMERYGIGG
ncbi:MAG TPA: sigma 54-interacting transcriptional regulator [Thermoanaerobaculia bacterium]|nr:sigma 54-interacting transcriptional regulator [Thermoanaerobaculia bacterium]